MTKIFPIYVKTTSIEIPGDPSGGCAEYKVDLRPILETYRELEFNKRLRRWTVKNRYYAYSTETSRFLLPRHALSVVIAHLTKNNVQYEIVEEENYTARAIDISIVDGWKDKDNQGTIIAHLTRVDIPMVCSDLQTGQGKSTTLDTPIRIPRGWKMMGDIQVGDTVISADGTETSVTGVFPQGKLPVYRVTFWDGRNVECSADHLWKIFCTNDLTSSWYTTNTLEILRLLDLEKFKVYVPLIEPEDSVDIEVYISPYQLGKDLCDTRRMDRHKSIPSDYLEGSIRQRLELIRGLLVDNNHTKTDSTITFCTVSEELATQIQYLVRSLGGLSDIVIETPHYYNEESVYDQKLYHVYINHRNMCLLPPWNYLTSSSDHNDKLRIMSVELLDESKEMQCISVSHPSKLYVVKDFIVTHNTYCAIKSICKLGLCSLVVCDGLVNQWRDEFLEKTNISPDRICVLQGAPSIVQLWKKKQEYDIFVASIDTIRYYALASRSPYDLLPTYADFLKEFQIGVKVIDEFHLNFSAIVSLDLRSTVERNLYLSATPDRSSKTERDIFKSVFPDDIILGGEAYKKYVNITFYKYDLQLPPKESVTTGYGYSHVKYEQILSEYGKLRQQYIDRVIIPLVNSHFINIKTKGQKLLIFAKTVAFCQTLQEYLQYKYPKLDIRTYTAADDDCNLVESDIIISTPTGCGTGKDIKNLRTVLLTCSMSSAPLVVQILGRLRILKNGDTPEFVDIYNNKLGSQYHHYRARRDIYKTRALKYSEHSLV